MGLGNASLRAGMLRRALATAGVLAVGFGGIASPAFAEEDPAVAADMAQLYAKKKGISAEVARERLDRQGKLVPVADEIRKTMGDEYAGAWFDNADGGRLKVGFASAERQPSSALVSRVKAVIDGAGMANEVDLLPVRATWAQLEAAQDKLDKSFADLYKTASVSTGLEPENSSVVVRFASGAAMSRGALDKIVDDPAVNIEIRQADAERLGGDLFACARRSDAALFCSNPLRGGVLMGYSSTGHCTPGFIVRSNSNDLAYVLTAGHCLDAPAVGVTWGSNDNGFANHPIGPTHPGSTFGLAGDYGLVRMNGGYWNTSQYVVYDGATTWNESYAISGHSGSYRDMPICATVGWGIVGGKNTDCGSVQSVNQTDIVGGVQVQSMGLSDLCVGVSGGSGGPFFKEGRAFGTLIGGSTCNTYYQGVGAALNGLNVHLVT